MPNAGPLSSMSGSATIQDPAIYNVPIPAANTEQSFALPSGTRRFTIKARQNSKIQLAYEAGKSGTQFVSVYTTLSEYTLAPTNPPTLYFRASKAGEVLEIVIWK